MATWPKHPNGVPRLDDSQFRLPAPDQAFRSVNNLDMPLTISRDGRIVNGHEQYRYYKRRGVKQFQLRVLPKLSDEELWAVALDLNPRRPEHAARPMWSYKASNGYEVEVFPPLTRNGHAAAIRTAVQQAAYLCSRKRKAHTILVSDVRGLNDVQKANELQAPLGETIKKQRRLNLAAIRQKAEERGRRLTVEGNYRIEHSDYRKLAWPKLDIIVTDPIWQNTVDYRELGEFAKRQLRPGGLLLAIAGSQKLADVGQALEASGLNPVDTLAIVYRTPMMSGSDHVRMIQSNWRPVLTFSQGERRPDPLERVWSNVVTVYGHPKNHKQYHDWQQPYWPIYYWLKAVVLPGDVIGDPFCGGGTVPLACKSIGRLTCIGTDIDQSAVHRSRARLVDECPREGMGFLERYRCERKPRKSH